MFSGLPIACFDVSFNRATTAGKAFFFSSIDELREIAGFLDGERAINCANDLRTVAEKRYQWKTIAADYESVFQSPNF